MPSFVEQQAQPWYSPETTTKLRRSQTLAKALEDLDANKTPYQSAAGTNYNILAKALGAWNASDADKQAQAAIASDKDALGRTMEEMFGGAPPDASPNVAGAPYDASDAARGAPQPKWGDGDAGKPGATPYGSAISPEESAESGYYPPQQPQQPRTTSSSAVPTSSPPTNYGRQAANLFRMTGDPTAAMNYVTNRQDANRAQDNWEKSYTQAGNQFDQRMNLENANANNTRDYQHRSLDLQNRQLGESAAQANEAARLAREQFGWKKDQPIIGNPGDQGFRLNPTTGQYEPVFLVPGGKAGGAGGLGTGSEAVRAAAGIPIAASAQQRMNALTAQGYNPNDHVKEGLASSLPFIGANVANAVGDKNYQEFDQAYKQWDAAVLPVVSGAAISASESARIAGAFKPMIGDSPETLARKNQARQMYIDGMLAAARGDTVALQKSFGAAFGGITDAKTLNALTQSAIEQAQGGGQNGQQAAPAVQLTSPEQWQAAPSGTVFVTPDGQRKRKP